MYTSFSPEHSSTSVSSRPDFLVTTLADLAVGQIVSEISPGSVGNLQRSDERINVVRLLSFMSPVDSLVHKLNSDFNTDGSNETLLVRADQASLDGPLELDNGKLVASIFDILKQGEAQGRDRVNLERLPLDKTLPEQALLLEDQVMFYAAETRRLASRVTGSERFRLYPVIWVFNPDVLQKGATHFEYQLPSDPESRGRAIRKAYVLDTGIGKPAIT